MTPAAEERYREPFARSLALRDEQHAQTEGYFDALWGEAAARRRAGFRPTRGTRRHARVVAAQRRRLGALIGYPPPHACSPVAHRIEVVGEARDYTVSRVWVRVAHGLDTYGIYLRPRVPAVRLPLLVAIHGGGGCPEAVCDLDTRVNYDGLGPQAARQGWAVWAPSLLMTVGYGGDPAREHDRYWMDRRARLVGTSVVGIESHRIISSAAALTRLLPELDAGRVSVAGLSYGGYFTLMCAALAPWVRAAVCSGYFGSFTERFARDASNAGADMRFPDLLGSFDMAELAGLVAPRALLIQNGRADEVIPVAAARAEAERAAAFWRAQSREEAFLYAEHDGGHVFDTAAILDFLLAHG